MYGGYGHVVGMTAKRILKKNINWEVEGKEQGGLQNVGWMGKKRSLMGKGWYKLRHTEPRDRYETTEYSSINYYYYYYYYYYLLWAEPKKSLN